MLARQCESVKESLQRMSLGIISPFICLIQRSIYNVHDPIIAHPRSATQVSIKHSHMPRLSNLFIPT